MQLPRPGQLWADGAGGCSGCSVLPARVMLPDPAPGLWGPGGDLRDKKAGWVSAVVCLEEGTRGDAVHQKGLWGWRPAAGPTEWTLPPPPLHRRAPGAGSTSWSPAEWTATPRPPAQKGPWGWRPPAGPCRVGTAPPPLQVGPLSWVSPPWFPRELRRAPRPISLPSSRGRLGSVEAPCPPAGRALAASCPLSPTRWSQGHAGGGIP